VTEKGKAFSTYVIALHVRNDIAIEYRRRYFPYIKLLDVVLELFHHFQLTVFFLSIFFRFVLGRIGYKIARMYRKQ